MAVAKKRKRIVIDLDEHRTKIRFGRAYLTVEQTVGVKFSPVEDALAQHRVGATSEEKVAEAFLKEQVIAHTPSFKWEEAELNVLLERVAEAMNDPQLKARTPSELIPELEVVEAKEREEWAELSKRMQEQIRPLAKDLQKKLQQASPSFFTEQMREEIRQHTQAISGSLVNNPALRQAMEPGLVKIHGSLSALTQSLLPQVRLVDLGIDPNVLEELRQSTLGALGDQALITTNWDQWIEMGLRAAQEAQVEEAVDADGTNAKQTNEQISDTDIKELIDRLSEIAKALQEQAGNNPFAMTMVASVISGLILYAIQYVLAVKYGITLTPPEKSSP